MPSEVLSGATIYYETHDFTAPWAPKRPALLFVHGINSSHEHWFNQVPVFCRDRKVISVDLRGHGASSIPPDGYSAQDHAGDLAELLDKLECNAVTVVGASLGGCIAQQLTARIPEKVKAVVLVGSCAQVPAELNRAEMLPMIEQMGFKNFLASVLPTATFSPNAHPGLIDFALRIGASSPDQVIKLRTLGGLAYDDLETARNVRCPALIVVGEDDKTTPRHCSETLRELIAGSSLAVVPACGHLPHLEAPDAFNPILERFLKQHPEA
ncbi:MAG TPA: alpha/beta hydrolase [Blastocatellia bacterium]|nr:alpha/beta hydrolase [Blastocatellia bacterium]